MDLLASSLVILLTPFPIVHYLFHGFLPRWRRNPYAFYGTAIAVWVVVSAMIWLVPPRPFLFEPGGAMRMVGATIMVISAVLVVWSIVALHPKRFFLWAVLHPESVEQVRMSRGPYRLLAHPAYTGYELVALGAFVASGIPEALALTGWLLIGMAIVMRLEEGELIARISHGHPHGR